MISRSFLRSSVIYSFVGSLPYVSGIILIPFFTSHLTPQQFGINAIYYSMMMLFQIIAGFALDSLVGVYYYEFRNRPEKLKELIGTVLTLILAIGALMTITLSVTGPGIFRIFLSGTDQLSFYPFGLLTVITAIFSAGFKSYTSLLINQQRVVRFLWLSLLNFTFTIGLSLFLTTIYPYALWGPILGRLVPMGITFTICLVLMLNEFGLKFSRELLPQVWTFCWPVFSYSILIWVINNIDRYVILHFNSDSSLVGIFDIAVKIALSIEILQIGLLNTIQPKIFAIWKSGDLRASTAEVNRYYNGFTAITLITIPLIQIIVPVLLPWVVKNPVYYAALDYLPVICLGFIIRPLFYMFQAPVYFFKKTHVLPRVLLITAIIQVSGTILLVRYFGIMGAVWASFLIKPVQTFFLWLESRKIFQFKFNKIKILLLPFVYFVLTILPELMIPHGYRIITATVQFLIILTLVIYIYRNELMVVYADLFKSGRK